MATPITADQLLAALKKWGVKYREYPGWRTRGRPGGITNATGQVEHHTGGTGQSLTYLKFLFEDGRPEDGIPGPLCNTATGADGTLHLGAIGRANHAGAGSTTTLNHVRAENYDGYKTELDPGPDDVNGNPVYYGNEIMYTGTVPMTDAQYQTAVLHAAAVCDFHGWTGLSVIGHREHTGRKNDPGKVLMNGFRTDVATVLRIGPSVVWSGKIPKAPTSTPPLQEFIDMDLDDIVIAATDTSPAVDVRTVLAKAYWLATEHGSGKTFRKLHDNWGEGGSLNVQLDRIEADTDSSGV